MLARKSIIRWRALRMVYRKSIIGFALGPSVLPVQKKSPHGPPIALLQGNVASVREKLGTAGDSKSTALPMGTCTRAKALQVLLNPSVFFQCLTRRAPQGVAGHLLFVDDRKGRMGRPNHRRRAARSSALGGWEGWLQGEQDIGAESVRHPTKIPIPHGTCRFRPAVIC